MPFVYQAILQRQEWDKNSPDTKGELYLLIKQIHECVSPLKEEALISARIDHQLLNMAYAFF